MVEDGVTGYLVDVGDIQSMADRIVELLQDKPKRQLMGHLAREVAKQRFASDMVANKTVQVYRDLIGRRGGQSIWCLAMFFFKTEFELTLKHPLHLLGEE
jgi:hypothetical protein